jgi:S-(hydroxymethyl)glutathione dehydrogenase / alcohol dehydrogenase
MIELPAIVLERLGQIPTLETVQLSEPGPGEVLVRILASGICHTDLGYMQYARACPVVLGHEGAGVVERTGDGVTSVQPGDHVVINWQPKCGRCRHCLAGRRDLCEDIHGTSAPRLSWKGALLHVMLNAGTFCPLAVVPENGAIPIRKDMPLEKAALLGCAVATGVGAALFTAAIRPGDRVVVIGAGGVGLNVIQGARLAGAGSIIAVDRLDERLALAEALGASHRLNSEQADPVKAISALTGGGGADYVFEVTGSPSLMAAGIEMLGRGGALVLVGAAGREESLSFKPRRFMSMQQRLLGCIYGNIRPELDLPLFADWYMQGRLHLDDLHTHTLALQDVPAFFANPAKYGGIRSVVRLEA